MNRSAWLRTLVSTAVGVALLAALALWGGVDWRAMSSTLTRLSPQTFCAALGIHTVIYLARAERFRVLLPASARPPRLSLLAVTSAHNLAVYVLPAKTGEATLPLYLKSTCGVDAAASLAALIVSRLFDLAALCAFLAAATLYVSGSESWSAPRWLGLALGLALFVAAFAFVALAARGAALVAPLQRLSRALRLDGTRLGARLALGGERLKQALRLAGERGTRLSAFGLSLAVWALIFTFYGVLARGFGLRDDVGFVQATFGSSLAVLMNLLPLNSFAGFGTQETGWVFGFRMVGVSPELSLPVGVGVHLVQLFDTVLFGLVGHFAMGLVRRR